jgi:hypothetical protein
MGLLVAPVRGSACGILEQAACGGPCEGGIEPIVGNVDQVASSQQPIRGASVAAPALCEIVGDQPSYAVRVETYGSDDDVGSGTWSVDWVEPELARGALHRGWGVGTCDQSAMASVPELRVIVHDWGDVGAISCSASGFQGLVRALGPDEALEELVHLVPATRRDVAQSRQRTLDGFRAEPEIAGNQLRIARRAAAHA